MAETQMDFHGDEQRTAQVTLAVNTEANQASAGKRIQPEYIFGTASRTSLTASVVLCAYTAERWSLLQAAVESIVRQTVSPHQVIIVADYNPVLYERLIATYPDLDTIPNTSERGLSGARNTGVKHAKGDIVVFLDDDAWADPGWLETLLASYIDESIVGVGGLVLADWGKIDRPKWFPEEFLWVVGCSYRGLPHTLAEVRNPIGANMSFRKAAFDQVGLFNVAVGRNVTITRPLGCEETEFSIRLLEVLPTSKILYEPRAVVHHRIDKSRGTWRYFLGRCYAEGVSKYQVAQVAGRAAALRSERRYVARTLTKAAWRELMTVFRHGDAGALGRFVALILGASWTVAGYLRANDSRSSLCDRRGVTMPMRPRNRRGSR
jgi:glycosyltransferase involved in cell wall biosynthesis